jgi:hypothetical protein
MPIQARGAGGVCSRDKEYVEMQEAFLFMCCDTVVIQIIVSSILAALYFRNCGNGLLMPSLFKISPCIATSIQKRGLTILYA